MAKRRLKSSRRGKCADCDEIRLVAACGPDGAERCWGCMLKLPALVPGGLGALPRNQVKVLDASTPDPRTCPVCFTRFDAAPDPSKAGRRPTYCSPKCRRKRERLIAAGRRALGALVSRRKRTEEDIDAEVKPVRNAVKAASSLVDRLRAEHDEIKAALVAGEDPSGNGLRLVKDLGRKLQEAEADLHRARKELERAETWAVSAKAALARGEDLEAAQESKPIEVW